MDNDNLKKSLGKFATGVMVATARNVDETLSGITINSFTSISLNPPLVSFCVGSNSNNLDSFLNNKYFALNILNESQADLAISFAKANNDNKWQEHKYRLSNNKTPVFDGVISYLECEKYKTITIGDHEMIIGKVVNCPVFNAEKPLLYYASQFSAIA